MARIHSTASAAFHPFPFPSSLALQAQPVARHPYSSAIESKVETLPLILIPRRRCSLKCQVCHSSVLPSLSCQFASQFLLLYLAFSVLPFLCPAHELSSQPTRKFMHRLESNQALLLHDSLTQPSRSQPLTHFDRFRYKEVCMFV